MSPPVLTLFNNKGGVGTSLVYHLAWMFSRLGHRVLVIDLDPQANLTAAFLDEETLEGLWENPARGSTVYQCLKPLSGVGDIASPKLQKINERLHLLPGDVGLAGFEDTFAEVWPGSMGDNNLYRPMRILSSFWQIMQMGAREIKADLILTDVGPNLGAINRSALIATDFVVVPLGADLFSLQGLKNLGPTLQSWRSLWGKRLNNWKESGEASQQGEDEFQLPAGKMEPIGYLCQQHSVRLNRPVAAYTKWVNRIPETYRTSLLREASNEAVLPEKDPYCLATIKHYRSLIPLAQESRKPIFQLTAADGAIGSHSQSARNAESDFRELALKIADKVGIKSSSG